MYKKISNKHYTYTHRVTFSDTNSAGNVYFARYVEWLGKCREEILLEHYPYFLEDLKEGFGFATENVHVSFHKESVLFDKIIIKMYLYELTKIRIGFIFEFYREGDELVADATQSLIWVNPSHKPSLMPDKLYNSIIEYFDISKSEEGQ